MTNISSPCSSVVTGMPTLLLGNDKKRVSHLHKEFYTLHSNEIMAHPNAIAEQLHIAIFRPSIVNVHPDDPTVHPGSSARHFAPPILRRVATKLHSGLILVHFESLNVHPGVVNVHPDDPAVHPGSSARHFAPPILRRVATKLHPGVILVHFESLNIHPSVVNVHPGAG